MKVTLIYDNTSLGNLQADWGFSCLVKFQDKKILFDTGAQGKILLENMKKLSISPKEIDEVFISHAHWDHTGGLEDFLKENQEVILYLPPSYPTSLKAREVAVIKKAHQLHENIFSTGELKGVEQSLIVETEKGLVIVVGCSHSGVKNILKIASQFGNPYALLGGFHDFKEFNLLENLSLICPTHCTQHISKIKNLHPEKFIEGGAGKIIEI